MKTLDQAIRQVSIMLDLPVEVVEKAYREYWNFIRYKISELPLKEDLTEEEFNLLRTNFNIPSLGKLYCSYKKLQNIKNALKKNIK